MAALKRSMAKSLSGPLRALKKIQGRPEPKEAWVVEEPDKKKELGNSALDITDPTSFQNWVLETMDELEARERGVKAHQTDKKLVAHLQEVVGEYRKPKLKRRAAATGKSTRAVIREKSREMINTKDFMNQQVRADHVWRWEKEMQKQNPTVRTTLRIDDDVPVETHLQPGNDGSEAYCQRAKAVDSLGTTSAFMDAISKYKHAANEARDKWEARVADANTNMRKAILTNELSMWRVETEDSAPSVDVYIEKPLTEEQEIVNSRPLEISVNKFDAWIAARAARISNEVRQRSKSVPNSRGRPSTAPT